MGWAERAALSLAMLSPGCLASGCQRLLVGLAWCGALTGAASPVLSGAGSFGVKQPP
jgi:hypothetical protein